ncbi:hypothetical protein ACW2QC_19715 [Virgibacillus sp. FSP13]
MRHPSEKFIRLELIAILIAALVGVFALIKGFLFIIILALYLIALSMFSGAIVEWQTHQTNRAGKHMLQAILLFIFTTYLISHL